MTEDEKAVAIWAAKKAIEVLGENFEGSIIDGACLTDLLIEARKLGREDPLPELRRAVEGASNAYRERNALVAAYARAAIALGWQAYRSKHDTKDPDWDPEWLDIIYIETPLGQLSWHIHASECLDFDFLELRENAWDGHTTEIKYVRLSQLRPAPLISRGAA